MKKEEVHPGEKEGYYLYSFTAQYQASKFLEMRDQVRNQHFQTFQELENAIIQEHFLRVNEDWDPNMNPFSDMEETPSYNV